MLLALGVILGLATWFHVAGRAGRAIDDGVDALVGAVRYIVPVAFVAAGVALFASSDDEDKASRQPARLAVGSVLVLVAGCGLLELSGRGGVAGWVAAAPSRSLIGSWATGTLLIALGLVGAVVLTQTSVLAAARRVGAGASALVRVAGRMFTLDSAGADERAVTASLYDQDADVDLRDRREPKRRKPDKPKLTVPTAPDEPEETEQLAIELGPAAKASPGSSRRCRCSSGPRRTRSTSPSSRSAAACSRPRSRSTASRPDSSAW